MSDDTKKWIVEVVDGTLQITHPEAHKLVGDVVVQDTKDHDYEG
jgi:hypothetical protein